MGKNNIPNREGSSFKCPVTSRGWAVRVFDEALEMDGAQAISDLDGCT